MIGESELHVYTCTFQEARVVAGTSPYQPGGTRLDFTTPAQEYTVPCRYHPLDSVTEAKMVGGAKESVMRVTAYLYVAYSRLPIAMMQRGDTKPEALFRVVNVRRSDGGLVAAGPLEITRITDMAGANDVVKIEVRLVQ